ncbi:hypothetical protein J7K05_00765 [bacterium]|nr:hypothetical protein [bacterium]
MNKKKILKNKVSKKIAKIVSYSIADSNTFLYTKCVSTIEKDSREIPIGGGNFTVLLSTLATIEFLGTVNAIVESKEKDFWSKKEIKELEEAKIKITKLYRSRSKKWITDFLLRPFGQMPKEGELKVGTHKKIKKLLKATKRLTNLNDEEIEKLLRVRNSLVHEFTPKNIPAAGLPFMPKADFRSIVLFYQSRDVFALTRKNEIGIDSNALSHKLHYLLKYILEKIDKLDDKKIQRIEKYLKRI